MNAATFPAPQSVALADALRWQASPDWLYELKADGKRALLAAGQSRGRAMRYPHHFKGYPLSAQRSGRLACSPLRRDQWLKRGNPAKALFSRLAPQPGKPHAHTLCRVLSR
jgi:hypothetical protein